MSPIGPFTTGCLFRGRPSVTEHCGHGWTCSLPRPVAIDPKPTRVARTRCGAVAAPAAPLLRSSI
jgi:hypothetical protein